jgi:hypothetical protein
MLILREVTEYVEKKMRIVRFLTKKLSIGSFLEGFTDIRVNPEISLRTILLSILLMPIYYFSSLLALDRWGRTGRARALFGSRRTILASDSTLARVLHWLHPSETAALLLKALPRFDSLGLLSRPLAEGALPRRLALIDGSQMSGTSLVCLSLLGAIRVPAIIRRTAGEGYEKAVAKGIIGSCKVALGACLPELLLLDALYFDRHVFRAAQESGMQVLVKFRDAEYREVSKQAAQDFRHFGGEREAAGYDSQRLCSYTVRVTESEYYGIPVLIAEVDEVYSKRHDGRWHEHFWIVSTDLSLSPLELREAAHLRWQIENNVFRRLNELVGTKRGFTRHPVAFLNLLRLFALSLATIDAVDYLFQRKPGIRRLFLEGQKPTWRTLCAALTASAPSGAFCLPP